MGMILHCTFKGNLHLAKYNDTDDEVQPFLNWRDKYNSHFKEITIVFQTTSNQYLEYYFDFKEAFILHSIHSNVPYLN